MQVYYFEKYILVKKSSGGEKIRWYSKFGKWKYRKKRTGNELEKFAELGEETVEIDE